MHYGFILRCLYKDGRIWHLPWQMQATSRKDALRRVTEGFERDNIFAPGMNNGNGPILEAVTDAGECEDGAEVQMYDAVCVKAKKLDAKCSKGEEAKVQKTI